MSKKKGGKKGKNKIYLDSEEEQENENATEEVTEAPKMKLKARKKAGGPPPPPPPIPALIPKPPELIDYNAENKRNFNCELKGWGFEDSNRQGYIRINGKCFKKFSDGEGSEKYRGLYVVIMTTQCLSSAELHHFDFWANPASSVLFAEIVENAPKGTLFFGASADEIHKNSSNANTALKELGIKVSEHISYRGSICFIGKKGDAKYHKVASCVKNKGPASLIVTVHGKIREDVEEEDYMAKIRTGDRSKIKPGELLDMKSRLKSIRTNTTKVILGRDRLVDEYKESIDRFPIDHLRDAFKVEGNSVITRVDLTGVDQMTDLVFYHMNDIHANSMLSVEHITLSGCLNITDQGIFWMAELFGANLKEVVLDGCKKLTEISIQHLTKACKNITSISMVSCDVGCLAIPPTPQTLKLELMGCPLVSPSGHLMQTAWRDDKEIREIGKLEPVKQYKAVIIKHPGVTGSLATLLDTNATAANGDGITDTEVKMAFASRVDCSSGYSFNVLECTSDLLYHTASFTSARTAYVLAYDVNAQIEETCMHLCNTIWLILNKYPLSIFNVVAVGAADQNKALEVGQKVQDGVRKRLKETDPLTREITKTNQWVQSDSNTPCFDEQERLQRLHVLSESLYKLNIDVTDQLHFDLEKIINPQQEHSGNRLRDLLQEAGARLNSKNPAYTEFGSEFRQLMGNLPQSSVPVPRDTYIDMLRDKEKNFGLLGNRSYIKFIEYMEMMGLLVELPFTERETLIVTEAYLPQLCQTINRLCSSKNEKPSLKPVPPSTHAVKKDKLPEVLVQSLLEMHLVCEIEDYIVPATALPLVPHVPLLYFIDMTLEDEMYSVSYSFRALGRSIPAVVMQQIVCAANNRLRTATVLSKWAVVIQEVPVEVLIEVQGAVREPPPAKITSATKKRKSSSREEKPPRAVVEKLQDTIMLKCQMSRVQTQTEKQLKEVSKIVRNTADMYKVLIDYILNINHIYTAQTVIENLNEKDYHERELDVIGVISGHRYLDEEKPAEETATFTPLTGQKVEKGMRLEALDRLTPSLIAVASIEDVRDGEVLVHFDGWGTNYDYWTTMNSPDLHPIGYMEQCSQHHQGNKKLQPPNGYVKTFEWNTYLMEVKNPPVPFTIFTKEQKREMKEYKFDDLTITFFSGLGKPIVNKVVIAEEEEEDVVDESSKAQNARCKDCFMQPKVAGFLWQIERHLRPTLTSVVMVRAQESHEQKGSWFTATNSEKELGVSCMDYLSPNEFSRFQVTLLSGLVLNLYLNSKGNRSSYVLSAKDGHIEHRYLTDDNEEGIVIIKAGLKINQGDQITVALEQTEDMKKELLQYFINEQLVYSTIVAAGLKFNPVITNSRGKLTYILDANKAMGGSGASQKWSKLMRLEALDRLNPSLVCCATVADVRESGEVLIHFDGWTDKYDYWTMPDSKDLHPLGYMAQRASKHTNLNQELQKPKSYQKSFDWDRYLVEERSPPVPFYLFNAEQTEGMTEWKFKNSTIDFFSRLGMSLTAKGSACDVSKHTVGALKSTMMKSVMEHGEFYDEWMPSKTSLFVTLPVNLTSIDILYPASIACMRKQAVYPLCPVKGNIHFLDSSCHLDEQDNGIQIDKLFNNLVRAVLLSMKNFLPLDISKLFPDLKQFELEKVHASMQRILYFQLCENHFADKSILDDATVVRSGSEYMSTVWDIFLKKFSAPEIGLENFTSSSGETDQRQGCTGHTRTQCQRGGLVTLNMPDYHPYTNLITSVNFANNAIVELPDNFLSVFSQLQELNLSHNSLKAFPAGGGSESLRVLDVSHNKLEDVPWDTLLSPKCRKTLIRLNVSGNRLHNLPDAIFSCTRLEELEAEDIALDTLPESVGRLKRLRVLSLAGNTLTALPESFGTLRSLEELNLSGMSYVPFSGNRAILSSKAFNDFMDSHALLYKLSEMDRNTLFIHMDTNNRGTLEAAGISQLNKWLQTTYPRLGGTTSDEVERQDKKESEKFPGGIPIQIFNLTNLRVLTLRNLLIKSIPNNISNLSKLRSLNLSNNVCLDGLSPQLANCPDLEGLNLKECPALRTPPKEIVRRGFNAVMGYLKRLLMGSVECKRTKLMMVGLGGAGKTSLVRALTGGQRSGNHYYGYSPSDELTDGIEIMDWTIREEDDEEGNGLTYSVWDFAGQVVYYNTHQFFMSNRAVYLLLWNIRLGHEHAGLEFWLSSIACHAPKAPIIVVGTHKDQVDKYWMPEADFMARYPQIRSFHAISTYTHTGIPELKQSVIAETLQQKYMGEKVPAAWLQLEKLMVSKRSECLLNWKTVEDMAMEVGIVDPPEIRQAVAFLHDLGSVQHFRNEYLKTRVVIDPQWIVDAMACVVSVHDTPIEDGRLLHKDLAEIWSNYDKKLLPWLLRLTEEFDLTFPIPDSQLNIVPCLLPSTEPEIEWPDVNDFPGHRETKMIYEFGYLPAGLFNRAQVRLYVFSDSSTIWKKGSLLKKNGHTALMHQFKDKSVLVKVQGPRPENILFLIHEVYETMIMESFHGVTYDYQMPCQDCVKAGKREPCLFPASRVRRATELKAPFLQCDMFFHTLSINELHATMPPDNNEDYDVHLERSLRELKDLRDELTYDIFMIYSAQNIPDAGDDATHPRQICDDLTAKGFKVWFSDDPSSVKIEDVVMTMRDARLVVTCISDEFVKDMQACSLFDFASHNLQKMMQLIVLGKTYNWQKTNLGMMFSSEVFVNMMQPKRYTHKIEELIETIKGKMSALRTSLQVKYPKVFVSYCWNNSHDAVKKGTRQMPGSLGWGDPRQIKEYLEEQGISCWMDVERVGQGGLFEDIADGLRQAKMMLVCVSDEYGKSKNCMIEIRFASTVLRLPIVVAVVGTGLKWEASEAGMLSLGFPKISFQHKTEGAHERLLEAIKGLLPEDNEEEEMVGQKMTGNNNAQAFQELLELAQRKFVRQLANYAMEAEESVMMPRLFIFDYLRAEEKKHLRDEEVKVKVAEREKLRKEALAAELLAQKERQKRLIEKNDLLRRLEEKNQGETRKKKTSKRSTEVKHGRPGSASIQEDEEKKIAGVIKALEKDMSKKQDETIDEESLTKYGLCIRFLCERETGWHEVPKFIPLEEMTSAELNDLLKETSGYMARILAILRHSGLDLQILKDTEEAQQLLRQMEELCGLKHEFKSQYLHLRNLIMEWTENPDQVIVNRDKGLNRCHLPSGKTIWLCKGDQNIDRITVFSDNATALIESLDREDTNFAEKPAPTKRPSTARGSGLAAIVESVAAAQQMPTPNRPTPAARPSLLRKASEKLQSGGATGAAANKSLQSAAKLASGDVAQSKACTLM